MVRLSAFLLAFLLVGLVAGACNSPASDAQPAGNTSGGPSTEVVIEVSTIG